MADYTYIDPNTLLPGEPWSSAKSLAALENPQAIAQGTPDAPVVRAGWHPYDRLLSGDAGTGLIYSFAVHGVVASVETPVFEDGYDYRLRGYGLSGVGAFGVVLQLYRGTAAAYDSGTALGSTTVGGAGSVHFIAEIKNPSVIETACFVEVLTYTVGFTNATNPAVASSSVTTSSPAQKITRAKIAFSSSDVDSGKIYLDRRWNYTSA